MVEGSDRTPARRHFGKGDGALACLMGLHVRLLLSSSWLDLSPLWLPCHAQLFMGQVLALAAFYTLKLLSLPPLLSALSQLLPFSLPSLSLLPFPVIFLSLSHSSSFLSSLTSSFSLPLSPFFLHFLLLAFSSFLPLPFSPSFWILDSNSRVEVIFPSHFPKMVGV